MRIQPITSYCTRTASASKILQSKQEPNNQPNFKGVKGFIKGGAAGAGITAFGVAFIAGLGAVPAFIPYVVLNGILGACSGGMLEKHLTEDEPAKIEK